MAQDSYSNVGRWWPRGGHLRLGLVVCAFAVLAALTASPSVAAQVQPSPGLLRVTTSPPTPTMISVDGVDRSQWGLDWLMLAPGTYEVCFSDAPALVTPVCRSVSISSGVTTETIGEYLPQATIIVSAVSESAQHLPSVISLDGAITGHGGVSTMRDPGPIDVCWGSVADFAPPPCQTVTLVSGVATTVPGLFTASPGSSGPVGSIGLLRVILPNPHPSTVLINGQPTTQWSIDWVPHPFGTYEVCYTAVPGFVAPGCATANVTFRPGGLTTTIGGLFFPSGTLRVMTSPPADVVISANGVPMNNWGLFTNVPAGSYLVCAEYPSGAVCDTAEVELNFQTALTFSPAGPVT